MIELKGTVAEVQELKGTVEVIPGSSGSSAPTYNGEVEVE